MDFHLDTLLNLPNVVADSYAITLDAIVVKLQLVNAGINCPNCSKYISSTPNSLSFIHRFIYFWSSSVFKSAPSSVLLLYL